MLLKQQSEQIILSGGGNTYKFFPSGDIKEFTNGSLMINQFMGNPLEGSVNNIYLKIKQNDGQCTVYPLLGYKSESKVFFSDKQILYTGKAETVSYRVVFSCGENGCWYWTVKCRGKGEEIQLIYGQDIGVGSKAGIRTNELYLSQYLDHFIDNGENGYTVCSRQNLRQEGGYPYVQQGCLNQKIIGYCTDAMQFFGKSVKLDQKIEALYGKAPEQKYQYELSYIGLWTQWLKLESEKTIVFYGIFKVNEELPVRRAMYMQDIYREYGKLNLSSEYYVPAKAITKKTMFGEAFSSEPLTGSEVEKYFPERIEEEYDGGKLLSFFKKNHTHVVLQEKELLVERPHGNIITNLPDDVKIRKDLMTSTNYIYGLFNAQTSIGNTDSNRLLCPNRGLLNLQKYTGQRIWIKIGAVYRVLAMPAAYETALNYSKWFYKVDDDMLIIAAYAEADAAQIKLSAVSEKGRHYEFIVTSQLSMGAAEFDETMIVSQKENSVFVFPSETSAIKKYCPELVYRIDYPKGSHITDDRIFFEDSRTRNGTMMCAAFGGGKWTVTITGSLSGVQNMTDISKEEDRSPEKLLEQYICFYDKFKRGFHLNADKAMSGEERRALEKLNILSTWYIHNAFVHFYVPRGLEQCSGAAWGTRDVCQGPMELFLSTGHFELAKETLLEVFGHQNIETKEWPQWFMFDRYPYMAGECHGDVIFWPLKCLGDYLEYTGDFSILKCVVPYRNFDGSLSCPAPIVKHVEKAFEALGERFVNDTFLISYAGGDWDDTLQPADPKMKDKLVSAWTQALAYQTMKILSKGIGKVKGGETESLAERAAYFAENIKRDFYQYLVKDGVIAGFLYMGENKAADYMLHPSDKKTGIHYRLLPLTRTVIADLADEKLAETNEAIIDTYLTFPDGVRLMDYPARYDGGASIYFQRAEQAANVGREISLQYVHAHIRYIEAMAVLGEGDKVYENLMKIVPVNIKEHVKNASLRQSNAYFSSSEGDFKDRYEYAAKFHKLKSGEIKVKGGWRIYSSGPGIFLGRLIGDVFGIREKSDRLEIDPVLSEKLNGTALIYECFGERFRWIYHISKSKSAVKKIVFSGKEVEFHRLENIYRTGGAVIRKEQWKNFVGEEISEHLKEIHIYLE